jgi:hypothetical protein
MTGSINDKATADDMDLPASKSTSLSDKTPEPKEAEDNFMSGPKLAILMVGLGIAVFLMALDMSILTTAIPLITAKFNSTEDIGWYMSGYLLTL